MNRLCLRLTTLFITLSLLLFVTACGKDDPGSPEPYLDNGETPGGETPGGETPGGETPGGEDPGGTTCTNPCTAGATRCVDEGAQTCVTVDGCPRWSDPTPCPSGQVCSGGQCAEQCASICEPGQKECVGDKVRHCEKNNDGCFEWADPTGCPQDHICSGGECTTTCQDACQDGELRCDNPQTFQVCQEQSSGCLDWSSAQSCPDSSTCSDGICDGCVQGARRCSDDNTTIEQCNQDQWAAVQSCPLGCEDAACLAQVACQPGKYQCNGNIVEVCNSTGSAYLHVSTCAVDCANGLCTGQCEPGERRCNGDKVETCDANGASWNVDETCDNRCEPTIAACAPESMEITTTTELDGTVVVDGPFVVKSGADLHSPTGDLTIIAASITVEEGGSITVAPTGDEPTGRGPDGATSNCAGGVGASYGTRGTRVNCSNNAPQPRIRDDEIQITPGSRGGDGRLAEDYEGFGSLGGGVLELIAEQIDMQGSLRADGANAQSTQRCLSGVGRGGGGSGGAIRLAANDLSLSGTISVAGGKGDTFCGSNQRNGGDGGEGVVKLLYGTSFENTATITAPFHTGLLAPLEVFSSTHPDPDRYYNDDFDSIALAWKRPFPTLQGYYHLINTTKNTVPTDANAAFDDADLVIYPRDAVKNGTNYFHIVSIDREFNAGLMEMRRQILINTLPPTLSSGSHPNQTQWSTNKNVTISWEDQRDGENFSGYYFIVDQFGDTVPTKTDTLVPGTQKQTILSNRADGIWAFHIVPVDTMGYLTQKAATYRFRIGDDPGTGTILGTVRDQDNQAIEGATITINRGLLNPAVPDQSTNNSGNYNLAQVPAGEWELRVQADGFETKDTTVTLDDGQSRSIDVTLQKL